MHSSKTIVKPHREKFSRYKLKTI